MDPSTAADSIRAEELNIDASYKQLELNLPAVTYEYNPLSRAQSRLASQATSLAVLKSYMTHLNDDVGGEAGILAGSNADLIQGIQSHIHANVIALIGFLTHPAYWRRFYRPTDDGSRKLEKELVVDPLWDELEARGDNLDVLEGAYDITPEGHFEMQKIAQEHIDNATSKTINLPSDFSVDSLSDLWLEYLPHVKGTTFYRAGSRGEEPLEAIPLEEAKKLVHGQKHAVAEINELNVMDCVGDNCEIPEYL